MAKDITALKDAIRDVLMESKLFGVRVKAEILLKKCVQTKEDEIEGKMMKSMMEGTEEEQSSSAAAMKRRGRPRKYGRQKVFATVNAFLFTLPNGSTVSHLTNNADIQEAR
jgi:hypothetical protein